MNLFLALLALVLFLVSGVLSAAAQAWAMTLLAFGLAAWVTISVMALA